MTLEKFEELFKEQLLKEVGDVDPAHDILHFARVVKTAKRLCAQEKASLEVVVPAAWLHDFVNIPKDDPRRSQASRLSAEAAVKFLSSVSYPAEYFSAIAHAIECHSFSANITPQSIEAKIVQDADRLDGLGAIGIARVFTVSGMLRRSLYDAHDPFCTERDPDDTHFTIDHFYRKLFRTAETLQTTAGRIEGQKRVTTMKRFLDALGDEIQLAP